LEFAVDELETAVFVFRLLLARFELAGGPLQLLTIIKDRLKTKARKTVFIVLAYNTKRRTEKTDRTNMTDGTDLLDTHTNDW